MKPKFPKHVAGLLEFLVKGREKANEDLAIGYFREIFKDDFDRQTDAKKADGYVKGKFILELKGATSKWLEGFFQGLTRIRDKDMSFSLIVVCAREFLAVWRLSEIPSTYVNDAKIVKGAPNKAGRILAKKYTASRVDILGLAQWRLRPEEIAGLFEADPKLILASLAQFQNLLQTSEKARIPVTSDNFHKILKLMSGYFDPPIKAVRAFYSILFDWNEASTVAISERFLDRATVGAGIVSGLIPTKRPAFKKFIEEYAIKTGESYDDFFSAYDRALDEVDPNFRALHGIFFTDVNLSRFAMWYVRKLLGDIGKNYLILDPACGSGNLVTNWRSPLQMRHKVVSEIVPDLLYTVDRRMNADQWHRKHGFTVIPRVETEEGLNFIDRSAEDYLAVLTKELRTKGEKPNKPIAILCNPPYKNDEDSGAGEIEYELDQTIMQRLGNDAAHERYAAFLMQMKLICEKAEDIGLPDGSLLLVFTKSKWLMKTPGLERIRTEIVGEFEDFGGFLINGGEFFKGVGKFPILFSMWRYVGENTTLNLNRPIVVRDLTWITNQMLKEIDWNSRQEYESRCEAILNDPKTIETPLGVERMSMKEWAGVARFNIYGNITSEEERKLGGIKSGFPRGDQRHQSLRDIWGVATGKDVGFMGDLTPCRYNYRKGDSAGVWFRLNNSFIELRKTYCLSGSADNRSYLACDYSSAVKLFVWYSMSKTFDVLGFPMWADAETMWAPKLKGSTGREFIRMCFALGLSENGCIETVFPANNPVNGVPEVRVHNPLCPTDPDSFWSKHLAGDFAENLGLLSDQLLRAVEKIYHCWGTRFSKSSWLPAEEDLPYFVGSGRLTAHSGLIQIYHQAKADGDTQLLELFGEMHEANRAVKKDIHDYLMQKAKLDYFGNSTAPDLKPFVPTTRFDRVLSRRAAVASYIIDKLHDDTNLGRTKLAKIFYLIDNSQNLKLEMNYIREAAGPLDPRAVYNEKIGLEGIAARSNFFYTRRNSGVRTIEQIRYIRGNNIGAGVAQASTVFGDKKKEVDRLIEIFAPLDAKHSEVIATLYACWNDLILSGKIPTEYDVIDAFYSWGPSKKKYAKEILMKSLEWMRRKSIIPKGHGSQTKPVPSSILAPDESDL